MNELQEHQYPPSWLIEVQQSEVPTVIITGSTELHEDPPLPQHEVDTSVVPAAEDRSDEIPSEEPTVVDSIKKPPTEPPGTAQESADDYPDDGENEPAQTVNALGELASGAEVSNLSHDRDDAHSSLPPGLEVIRDEGVTIVANRNHPDQELVSKALAAYRDNPVWPDTNEQFPERTYHVDDEDDPTLFAKATNYAFYSGVTASEGLNELILSEEIKQVVNSDEAQQVVRDAGFNSVAFVEPLLTASPDGSNTRMTVYPWEEGRPIGTVAIERERAEGRQMEDGLRIAADIADNLRVLFSEKGINARDLEASQIRVDSDNNVQLTDAELYVRFDKPVSTLAPDQVVQRKDDQWHEGVASPQGDLGIPKEIFAEPGEVIVARGSNSEQSPELATEKGAGRVIVLWNAITKEGAIVNNVDARQLGNVLNEVYERLPNLKGPGTIEHAVGNYDLVRHPVTRESSPSARKSVPVTGVVDVRLDTATGIMEVYSKAGERLYKYRPPSSSGA